MKHPRSWTCFNSSCWNLCRTVSHKPKSCEELSLLFALGVKINAAYFSPHLVEANVVKPFEAGACYGSNPVIRYQKVFLPPHKNVLLLSYVGYRDRAFPSLFLVWTKCTKLSPVTKVDFGSCAPIFVLCNEVILGSNDFAFKICCECRVIFREPCTFETQVNKEGEEKESIAFVLPWIRR